jgi:mannose-1-phosphate guanylyltransferase
MINLYGKGCLKQFRRHLLPKKGMVIKMKALFLAGGMGTRLKPLTDELPKPMVPIMNKPLLERSMANLEEIGINEIVISTCYKSKYIKDYFGDGSKFGLKIEYICEDIPLGTGGAIKKAGHLFNDTFLVFNADILCNMDFKELVKFHQSKSAKVTIAVTQVNNPCAYGVIEYNENDYAVSFTEKPKADKIKSNFINAGVYVIEPEVLGEIPEDRPVSVEREIFPALLCEGYKVAVYKGCSYWMDIGTPEKYLQTHEDIMAGACQISGVHFSSRSVFKDGKSIIDTTAVITGPVYIGDNVRIGAYATIGPNTVLGDNVCIHMGGTVIDSILWNNVNIGSCAKMKGSVAASDCKVEHKTVHSDTAFTTSESVEWLNSRRKTTQEEILV